MSKSAYRLMVRISRSEVRDLTVAQNSHIQNFAGGLSKTGGNTTARSLFYFMFGGKFLAVLVSDRRIRLLPSYSECFCHTD